MDLFSKFCNICCKTDGESLRNIAEDNMKHIKDTLITFLGHADIINNNIINLCQLCCEKLTHSNKFRDMCLSNLIQLRQNVLNMKSKLELEDETCAVETKLQIFVHEEVQRRKTLDKCNKPVSNSTEHFAGNSSDVSVINTVTECNECQIGFAKERSGFLQCDRQSDKAFEFVKVEFDSQNETDISASEDFAPRNFESVSGGLVNPDVNTINNNEGFVNAEIESKEIVHVKQERSIYEDLELETVRDKFRDSLNVPFEFVNIPATVQIEENVKDDMQLPSRDRKNEPNAVIMNEQPSRPHVRKSRNGRCSPTQKSRIDKRVYPGTGPYTCALCNKSFKNRSNLTVHERIHNGDKPYKCTICNKTFRQLNHLTVHERIHSGDRPYDCSVCDKAFTDSSSLIRHERTHSGERPYKCTDCNKTFTDPSALIKHERIHSGERPYECTVCNKAFRHFANLTVHERTHSGDRPYECTVCHKAFINSSQLIVHERIHSGDRPYKCSVCDKAFASSSSLTIHERIHSGDKPYKCTMCTRAYTNSSDFTKHTRTHTDDKPII